MHREGGDDSGHNRKANKLSKCVNATGTGTSNTKTC